MNAFIFYSLSITIFYIQYNIQQFEMLTDRTLKERQLDDLYEWVDTLALSKPKKNINRDFSDATMMAQVIYQNFPKMIEVHNYPATSSLKSKLSNWTTLNNKVFRRLGITLTNEDCQRLSSSTPGAIQALLYQFKNLLVQNQRQKQNSQTVYPDQVPTRNQGEKESIANKLNTASKVEQLREVLNLIKEKIAITERSIQRKDSHIRELQEILKQYNF